MRRIVVVLVGMVLALAGLVVTGPAATAAARCGYQVHVLPGLPGSDGSGAVNGVSSRRTVAVGSASGVPVYWERGVLRKVPLPAGYSGGRVTAVNDHGLMVGSVSGPDRAARAFRYQSHHRAIRLYPKGSVATDVNDGGRAVGFDGERGYEYWHGTHVRRTLALSSDDQLQAITGINDANRIIGWGRLANGESGSVSAALTWSSRVTAPPTELGPAEGSTYRQVSALGIDNRGRIVGHDYAGRVEFGNAVYWPDAQSDLVAAPNLGDSPDAAFTAISPTGSIMVGQAAGVWIDDPVYAYGPSSAVLWRGTGPMTGLPSLSAEGDAGATSVDRKGRVGGTAVDDAGVTRPVIWTCDRA